MCRYYNDLSAYICLVFLSGYLYTYLSLYSMSAYLSICPSVCLYASTQFPSNCLPVCLHLSPYIHPSIHPSICSVYKARALLSVLPQAVHGVKSVAKHTRHRERGREGGREGGRERGREREIEMGGGGEGGGWPVAVLLAVFDSCLSLVPTTTTAVGLDSIQC